MQCSPWHGGLWQDIQVAGPIQECFLPGRLQALTGSTASACFLHLGAFPGAEILFLIYQLLSSSSSRFPPLAETDGGRETSPAPAAISTADSMGNCFTTQPRSLQLNISDFKDLILNYSYYDQDYDAAAAAPCLSSYCSLLGSSIPSFLAVVCALGLLSNLVLVVALATCRSLWSRPPGRNFLFQLTLGTTLFAATLPFVAAGISHGWVFGDGFCKATYMLWYWSLFAEGLLVAAGTCSAWQGKKVPRQYCWGMGMALWVASALLAVPALFMSGTEGHPQEMCLWRGNSELQWWNLVHVTTCLAVFILLPIALGVAKAMLTRHRSGWQLRVGVTWLFFLLWAPYGIALLLDSLQRWQLLSTSCLFWENLDFFLGLSEGLGVLHCFLGPLLLLGAGLYHRRTDSGPGPLGMPGQHVPGLRLVSPQCSKPMSQVPQKA